MRGNAGAFGGEIKDVAVEVVSLDTATLEVLTRANAECGFGYRNSVFKERPGEIILTATFALQEGDPAEIARVIEERKEYRRKRHPLEYPNIGSIFKNVDLKRAPDTVRELCAHVIKVDPFPVIPTAFLLSEAGLKGLRRGGAMISPKHPNFIVNIDHAASGDVRGLVAEAKQTLLARFRDRVLTTWDLGGAFRFRDRVGLPPKDLLRGDWRVVPGGARRRGCAPPGPRGAGAPTPGSRGRASRGPPLRRRVDISRARREIPAASRTAGKEARSALPGLRLSPSVQSPTRGPI